jgi:hypothetical protein
MVVDRENEYNIITTDKIKNGDETLLVVESRTTRNRLASCKHPEYNPDALFKTKYNELYHVIDLHHLYVNDEATKSHSFCSFDPLYRSTTSSFPFFMTRNVGSIATRCFAATSSNSSTSTTQNTTLVFLLVANSSKIG